MPFVHILDLAADGRIDHHVDSIKFSGDIVCGISLGSAAIMELKYDADAATAARQLPGRPRLVGAEAPAPDKTVIRMRLPRRSLYFLIAESRYCWSHAVLGGTTTFVPGGAAAPVAAGVPDASEDAGASTAAAVDVVRNRRISLIFRDEMDADQTPLAAARSSGPSMHS